MENVNLKQQIAIKQLLALKKLSSAHRLAADGWDEEWKILVATLMSARTTDKKTIPVAEGLFKKYSSIKKLSKVSPAAIAKLIRPVNFYKTKSRNISRLAKILVRDYCAKVPHDFEKLIELPGVGRKTANVFLAEVGHNTIGVDTHVTYCSRYLGWTKHAEQEKIEADLKSLFPQNYWGELNWILVRFGQTYTNRREKNEILDKIKQIK
ncbi:G/T mismatches repair enzyme [uncultured archaeon]|nr:G/T mismatches repair enzyme [uncultured archaeon]